MRNFTRYIVLIGLLLCSMQGMAITKVDADNEYKKGNYQQAIKDYNELLRQGTSADLYYNLGNAYYRSDNITQAVLAYERAHLLSPGDDDIKFNLEFARSKTIDKFPVESEMFFVTWYRALVNFTSVDHWGYIAIFSIAFALFLMLVYLFGSNIWMRKIGFYGSVVFVLVFALSNLFAYQQREALMNRSGAIVISSSVPVYKTPTRAESEQFVIHEGTKVEITDKTMKGWRGVKLSDGRTGWIQENSIEEI